MSVVFSHDFSCFPVAPWQTEPELSKLQVLMQVLIPRCSTRCAVMLKLESRQKAYVLLSTFLQFTKDTAPYTV